ncbi:MAG: hypothetical protein ACI8WB_005291 [Phenylobacterium sp.]|jgi:hypothetical protein
MIQPLTKINKGVKAAATVTVLSSMLLFTTPVMADWLDDAKSMLSGLFGDEQPAELTDDRVAQGLKEALSVGTQTVMDTLGKAGGFANNPDMKIGLPDSLKGVSGLLEKAGMGSWITDLEDKLNQAAEKAVPEAGPVLLKAIKNMDLKDIQGIYQGKDGAATEYFKSAMSGPIGDAMTPIIKESLADVGAMETYEKAMKYYQSIPMLPKVDGDLLGWVKTKAMSGIFDQLATEEAAIRKDPAKQTTDLLKQLFKP